MWNQKAYIAMVPTVIKSAQDVIDALAYCLEQVGGKNKIPLSLKRGLGEVLSEVSPPELAEANNYRLGEITLNDALKILHPKVRR